MTDPGKSQHESLSDAYRDELWRRLEPIGDEIERSGSLDTEALFPVLTELGLWGLLIPSEFGGQGLSISKYVPVIAELAKINGAIRALVHVHNSMCHGVAVLGNIEQRRRVLSGASSGAASVAFALTEPDHGTGSDIGTRAEPDGEGGYEISGRKWLITNSDFATTFIVFARAVAEDGSARDGVTAFLVPRDAVGLTIEPLEHTMGCVGGQHGELTFERVKVSRSDVLGGLGRGLLAMEDILILSRVLVAASSLGVAEYALELSIVRANERHTFGAPIIDRQAIQRYLAEMARDVYALRLMLADCARRWDAGEQIPLESSLAKLFGLQAVGRVTDLALLIFGGIGYTRRYPIERLYRDARLNWLEEGTPTIQEMVAVRAMRDGERP